MTTINKDNKQSDENIKEDGVKITLLTVRYQAQQWTYKANQNQHPIPSHHKQIRY